MTPTCDPYDVDAFTALGDLFARRGKPVKAEAAYKKAVEADPSDVLAYENLGKHQIKRGKVGMRNRP